MIKYQIQVSAFTLRGDFKGTIRIDAQTKDSAHQSVDYLVNAISNIEKLSFETSEGVMIVLTKDILCQSVLGFKVITALE